MIEAQFKHGGLIVTLHFSHEGLVHLGRHGDTVHVGHIPPAIHFLQQASEFIHVSQMRRQHSTVHGPFPLWHRPHRFSRPLHSSIGPPFFGRQSLFRAHLVLQRGLFLHNPPQLFRPTHTGRHTGQGLAQSGLQIGLQAPSPAHVILQLSLSPHFLTQFPPTPGFLAPPMPRQPIEPSALPL